jgi:ribonuclease Z
MRGGSSALTIGGIDVVAVSVGGFETCIEVPSWQLCFDIGRCPPSAVKHRRVCFTHSHVDHMGGIAHHVSLRDLLGMPPAEYLVPEPSHGAFCALLDAWRALDRSELPANVRGVTPGDAIETGRDRRIHVFQSYHRVPTVGYALERRSRRLKPELVGLPSDRIVAMRAAGVDIHDEANAIELAFCGDTLIEVVEREEHVRRARVLILECTFLDDRAPVAHARKTGHVHLDEIVERAPLFGNEAILLTHFSPRYGRSEILAALDAKLPPGLRERVVPLLPGGPVAAAGRVDY